jgi:lipid II:glycine glycyltransferase (peptidoglycan interpeptide bridge formation enzyme)
MRWARARGCALYDFRAIAEVLEPDEDMYSLYTYKRGFGGYSLLTLETHDLPLSAPLYWMYRRTLKVKRDRVRRQHLRELRAREQAQKSATTTQAAGSAKE